MHPRAFAHHTGRNAVNTTNNSRSISIVCLCRQIDEANERIATLTAERNNLQDTLDRVRSEVSDTRRYYGRAL